MRNEDKRVIKTGKIEPGSAVFVQICRKCSIKHETTHVLFVCQDRDNHCNGTMTVVLDVYTAMKG